MEQRALHALAASRLLRHRYKRRHKWIVSLLMGAALIRGTVYSHTSLDKRLSSLETIVRDLDQANTRMVGDLSQQLQKLTGITYRLMNNTDRRLNKIVEYIHRTHSALLALQRSLADLSLWHTQWAGYLQFVLLAYIQTMQNMQLYLRYVQRLGLGVHALTRGQLTPYLLSHKDLVGIQEAIDAKLAEKLPGYKIGLNRLEEFYHLPLEAVMVSSGILYVSLAVPITHTMDTYDVYRIQTFPI